MSLRFVDGFDHYTTVSAAAKWNTVSSAGIAIEQAGRFGGGNLYINSFQGFMGKVFESQPTWIVGFALKPVNITVMGPILKFLDAGSQQCELYIGSDMTLNVRRANTVIPGGTSAATLPLGVWSYVEMKVTISDSIAAGSCQVRIGGAVVIDLPVGSDVKSTLNGTVNQIQITANGSGNVFEAKFDDLYICDGTGTAAKDFLGDIRVETLYPTGAGAKTTWVPSAGSNFDCVNEPQINNDTDYVASSNVGDVDVYTMSDLTSVPVAIHGVQVGVVARKDEAGARTLASVIRLGNADHLGPIQPVLDGYVSHLAIREVDPVTTLPWTKDGVNAMEAGVRLFS